MKVLLSKQFIAAIKLSDRRQYQIAFDANVNPTILSAFISGIRFPKENDSRVIAVGKVVGLSPQECFQTDSPKPKDTYYAKNQKKN